jgi:hypothetical protein
MSEQGRCQSKPDLVTLVREQERKKDFRRFAEIVGAEERPEEKRSIAFAFRIDTQRVQMSTKKTGELLWSRANQIDGRLVFSFLDSTISSRRRRRALVAFAGHYHGPDDDPGYLVGQSCRRQSPFQQCSKPSESHASRCPARRIITVWRAPGSAE